ncbi:FAD-binding protein [Rhodococcus rhodnii]|uniref:assimilatory sulfite reductase (NADPH) n=2 Tax=Rhodococcus rhodnii TaxID=38312 RepID=R7WLV7_9NOCA|nr:sulfite reductase [Rhodococcus rhodnii]EOM74999.1 sulfite reductase [NADPH] flavoprotein [Rhodococcus rhodnii LMG 5362]TXG91113.1 FAD-binding protein [Rhodococcus rhodnii]
MTSAVRRSARASRSPWNRKNPFAARVVTSTRLTGPGSSKDVRHHVLDLADSGIEYEPGDGLGIHPVNDPALVDAVLTRLGASPEAVVAGYELPLADVLRTRRELTLPSRDLLEYVATHGGPPELLDIAADRTTRELWRRGKDAADVLDLLPSPPSVEEFVALAGPLAHRTYSISSAPSVHPGVVHLTVSTVRGAATDRPRSGACSTHLADRLGESGEAAIFLVRNKSFRLPADDAAPVIMIGPGTGVAPFRAFLQERDARGATGGAWLFYGDRTREHDFLYRDEFADFRDRGVLTELDLAFSRDGDPTAKQYVQHRMRERGDELVAWLDRGAHLYVCGDTTMATDVDDTLVSLVAEHRGATPGAASDYVADLRTTKRYVRDVY